MIILPVLVASYKWTLVTTTYPQNSGLSMFQVTFGSIAITLMNWLSVQYPPPYCFVMDGCTTVIYGSFQSQALLA